MAITRSTWIDDDGSGTTGTILNNAELQKIYNAIDSFTGGLWTPVPFNAANYTASAGIWTVPSAAQVVYTWVRLNQTTILVSFVIGGTLTTSASTASLFIALPAPIPAPIFSMNGSFNYSIGAALGTGYVEIQPAGKLRLLRDAAGTPFPASSGYGQVVGQVFYQCA